MATFLYKLYRHRWNGMPMSRWVIAVLGILALVAWRGWLPVDPRWDLWVSGAALGAAILFAGIIVAARRRNFIAFHLHPDPPGEPVPLTPGDKLPVHASGRFGVENRYRPFTWLQGFYRTFATREHAIICLVPSSRFLLLGRWPETETGMWYIFVQPDTIHRVRFGEVRFGRTSAPGVAIDYTLHIPKRGRFRPARNLSETAYLACDSAADAARIYTDLRQDLDPPGQSAIGSPST